jgi:hypothetical protein
MVGAEHRPAVNKEIPSMDMNDMIGASAYGRRQFLGAAGVAALAVGASQFGIIPKAAAQSRTAQAAGPAIGSVSTVPTIRSLRPASASRPRIPYRGSPDTAPPTHPNTR